MRTKSETMTERECASPLCDRSFEPASPYEEASYCSRECYNQEKAYDESAPSQGPVRDQYARRWALRIKLGGKEIRVKLPSVKEL